MAIVHNRQIKRLETSNNDDKVVCGFGVFWESYDDSDQDRTTSTCRKRFNLETEGITSETEGFVNFESLTQETLEQWLGSEFTEYDAKVRERHEERIHSIQNPVTPATITREVPW